MCGGGGTLPGHEGAREALRALAEGWREHLPVLGDWYEGTGGLDFPAMDARGEMVTAKDLHRDWAEGREDMSVGAWIAETFDAEHWFGWTRANGQPAVPRSLAECPAVAWWALAWLAGTCPRCSWKQGPMLFDRREDAREWCRRNRHALKMVAQVRTTGTWGLWLSGEGRWANWGDVKERKPCECAGRRAAVKAHLTAAWERETVECGCYEDYDRRRIQGYMDTGPTDCRRCAGLGRVRPEGVPQAHAAAQ